MLHIRVKMTVGRSGVKSKRWKRRNVLIDAEELEVVEETWESVPEEDDYPRDDGADCLLFTRVPSDFFMERKHSSPRWDYLQRDNDPLPWEFDEFLI